MMKMFKTSMCVAAAAWFGLASPGVAQDTESFIGRWALTLPNNGAGWLGLEQKDGVIQGSLLWGGGSVKPLHSVATDGKHIRMTRILKIKLPSTDDQPAQWQEVTETLEGTLAGDRMELVQVTPEAEGDRVSRADFSAQRLPPLPPKPDLSKVRYGEPVHLFNGKDLEGWKLLHPSHKNGWAAKDGVLVNHPEEKGKGYGNLRTEAEFEDFTLSLEVLVPEKSNSGIFLRGMYEIQVLDSHGRPTDSHHMGAVYSRITPSQSAEKPHGTWQDMKITLCRQHVTVVLNGVTIIDNEPLLGCTGGALSADPLRPGPILLQGNHGAVEYRNLILTPIES